MQASINNPQLHTVSRSQQGRQRELSVKTLRSSTFRRILEALHIVWRNSTPLIIMLKKIDKLIE